MRTGARKDANHNEIQRCFEKMGYSVKDVSQLPGFCDLVIGKPNFTKLIEIKDGSKPPSKRVLTPAEQDFHNYWNDEVAIIESIEDVVAFDKAAREKPNFQGRRNKDKLSNNLEHLSLQVKNSV
jgi:hypothetical protein